MSGLVRRIRWDIPADLTTPSIEVDGEHRGREWLVTNGLGGFASGTVAGTVTRRYHGLLVAALPAPHGRLVMLSQVTEELVLPNGTRVPIGGAFAETPDRPPESQVHYVAVPRVERLTELRLEMGLPVWRYEIDGFVVEKRVVMLHMQNTVHVSYRLLSGSGSVRIEARPWLDVRHLEAPVSEAPQGPHVLTAVEGRFDIAASPDLPPLRLTVDGEKAAFMVDRGTTCNLFYPVESHRGYDAHGPLWSPGIMSAALQHEHDATLVASTEQWSVIQALSPSEAQGAERKRRERLLSAAAPAAQSGMAAELVLAADQFIITPAGRVEDAARAHAAGDEVRTVIAGYHWFTDWGRDTMISLEGLTLTTGRYKEAGYILRTFAHYIRDGLIPNLFPEGQGEGLYHTADATLWFFHALYRYVTMTGDRETLQLLLPKLMDVVDHHRRGTRFGIHVDHDDGLLVQGAEGYQLTWMDAKVGDWVVTPRRGKAVEINALWYNALRLLEGWTRDSLGERAAQPYASLADRVRHSFNQRFWYADGGYLYDVVDGPDGNDQSCRPNQVFAISLDHPVLSADRWTSVMDVVERRLLTPVGLRSLAPGSPDYKPRYYGDLRSRDAAYHQGTVWAWLIGPWVDAWLKLHPHDEAGARTFLVGFEQELERACVGTIGEIFDAEPPYTPRGCVAQAWSVAEVLRCCVKTAGATMSNGRVATALDAAVS